MDEITSTATNDGMTLPEAQEAPDAFLAGWDEPDDMPPADVQEHMPKETPTPTEQTDNNQTQTTEEQNPNPTADNASDAAAVQAAQPGAEAPPPDAARGPAQPPDSGPTWKVIHQQQERLLRAQDVTPELLQKGLDYDRIRAIYDEAKPAIEVLRDLSRSAGMTVPDFAKYIRAQAKRNAGMSEDDAKRAVELEDREAAISAKETEAQNAANAEAQRQQRIRDDIAEFSRSFPEAFQAWGQNPQTIPQSIWDEVNQGIPLTAAYSRFAVKQAQAAAQAEAARAAAQAQNSVNAARSTGSLNSAGNSAKIRDSFLDGFDAE